MADFCKQCSINALGEDYGDMAGICKPNEVANVLCESCGPTSVDHTGQCVGECLNAERPGHNGRPCQERRR